MFGPLFGASAEQRKAMGLSSDPFQAEKQVATGNYNPNASVPIVNNATVGTSGMRGGARMSDTQIQNILNQMKTGALDPKVGALTLSQNQVNLYDLVRISGQSPEAILAAAASNGIRIQDALGQNGVIQQGGLLQGMSLADAARSQGGQMVDLNAGTGLPPQWSYQGPQGSSFVTDLSRLTMGGPQTQNTIDNWANTAQTNMNANIAANGQAAADLYNLPLASGLGATNGSSSVGTVPSTGTTSSTGTSYDGGTQYHISPSSPFLDRSKAGGWFNFGGAPNSSGGYDPLRPFGGGLPPMVNQQNSVPAQQGTGALTQVQNNV